jgi:hypothetical protein
VRRIGTVHKRCRSLSFYGGQHITQETMACAMRNGYAGLAAYYLGMVY